MKVIIAGGRDFQDYDRLVSLCSHHLKDYYKIITGGAPGADELGKQLALEKGYVHIEVEARWDKYGKAAGPMRNAKMASMGDMLIALWDGRSPGTRSMIKEALKKGLEIHVYKY